MRSSSTRSRPEDGDNSRKDGDGDSTASSRPNTAEGGGGERKEGAESGNEGGDEARPLTGATAKSGYSTTSHATSGTGSLANCSATAAQTVVLQGGAYGEHARTSVQADELMQKKLEKESSSIKQLSNVLSQAMNTEQVKQGSSIP